MADEHPLKGYQVQQPLDRYTREQLSEMQEHLCSLVSKTCANLYSLPKGVDRNADAAIMLLKEIKRIESRLEIINKI